MSGQPELQSLCVGASAETLSTNDAYYDWFSVDNYLATNVG